MRYTRPSLMIRNLRDAQTSATLIGKSRAFSSAIAPLPTIARCGATVLIIGETGTGKELVARAIHYLSERAGFPFVPINCGSLPETLLEDELFGHERGAFTDAHTRRSGLIAQAEKGTLFLDEVDTLSARAQVTFLRVLQDKRFRSVGSSVEQESDVRIVAATNAKLDHCVRTGTFRADLYFRLSVFTVDLPPLRERRDDIPILASHFLEKHTPEDRAEIQLSPRALAALVSCSWAGNIRELENAIVRGIHLSHANTVEVEDLGLQNAANEPSATAPLIAPRLRPLKVMKQEMIEVFERDYLLCLMREQQGNVSRAAQMAGKERRELGKLLKKYQLDPKRFRSLYPTLER